MEELVGLVGKSVEVVYNCGGTEIFVAEVTSVRGNLVFCTNVRKLYEGQICPSKDQIINTASASFVRFNVLN